MSSESKEKILDKVKKCLALSKSSNPHEADIALRQARKLMDAHKLELSDVQAAEVNESRFSSGKRPSAWVLVLGQACAIAFRCTVLTSKTYRGETELVFIGVDNTPEFSRYAYEVLSRQLLAARRAYVLTQFRCKLSTKRRRGEIFANSWVRAVHSLIASFSDDNEQIGKSISAYMGKNYPSLVDKNIELKKITKKDREASWAGHSAGKSAQLHRPMSRDMNPSLSLF